MVYLYRVNLASPLIVRCCKTYATSNLGNLEYLECLDTLNILEE